jgi:MFS family permease
VFLPALITTPLAAPAIRKLGTRRAFRASLAIAGLGLPLLLLPHLAAVVVGLACVGAGTCSAPATATGVVGRAASDDPGSASGMYLASYFTGGLAGAAVVGQLFTHAGWPAAVAAVGVALALATWLARDLVVMATPDREPRTLSMLSTH